MMAQVARFEFVNKVILPFRLGILSDNNFFQIFDVTNILVECDKILFSNLASNAFLIPALPRPDISGSSNHPSRISAISGTECFLEILYAAISPEYGGLDDIIKSILLK